MLRPAGSGEEAAFLAEKRRPDYLCGDTFCETGISPPSEEANHCCIFSVVPSQGGCSMAGVAVVEAQKAALKTHAMAWMSQLSQDLSHTPVTLSWGCRS
jgi:hypothetical protein